MPCELGFWLARLAGLEPATGCLEGSCSIQLSYRRPRQFCTVKDTHRQHEPGNRDLQRLGPTRWQAEPKAQPVRDAWDISR
jgi:hypothetical protein